MKSLFHLIRRLRLHTACATTLALGSCAVQALSVDEARHLQMRTAFGAAPHEIRELRAMAGHYDEGDVECERHD